jgi:hypothetical protein
MQIMNCVLKSQNVIGTPRARPVVPRGRSDARGGCRAIHQRAEHGVPEAIVAREPWQEDDAGRVQPRAAAVHSEERATRHESSDTGVRIARTGDRPRDARARAVARAISSANILNASCRPSREGVPKRLMGHAGKFRVMF